MIIEPSFTCLSILACVMPHSKVVAQLLQITFLMAYLTDNSQLGVSPHYLSLGRALGAFGVFNDH
jgi:hypothetical protein